MQAIVITIFFLAAGLFPQTLWPVRGLSCKEIITHVRDTIKAEEALEIMQMTDYGRSPEDELRILAAIQSQFGNVEKLIGFQVNRMMVEGALRSKSYWGQGSGVWDDAGESHIRQTSLLGGMFLAKGDDFVVTPTSINEFPFIGEMDPQTGSLPSSYLPNFMHFTEGELEIQLQLGEQVLQELFQLSQKGTKQKREVIRRWIGLSQQLQTLRQQALYNKMVQHFSPIPRYFMLSNFLEEEGGKILQQIKWLKKKPWAEVDPFQASLLVRKFLAILSHPMMIYRTIFLSSTVESESVVEMLFNRFYHDTADFLLMQNELVYGVMASSVSIWGHSLDVVSKTLRESKPGIFVMQPGASFSPTFSDEKVEKIVTFYEFIQAEWWEHESTWFRQEQGELPETVNQILHKLKSEMEPETFDQLVDYLNSQVQNPALSADRRQTFWNEIPLFIDLWYRIQKKERSSILDDIFLD